MSRVWSATGRAHRDTCDGLDGRTLIPHSVELLGRGVGFAVVKVRRVHHCILPALVILGNSGFKRHFPCSTSTGWRIIRKSRPPIVRPFTSSLHPRVSRTLKGVR